MRAVLLFLALLPAAGSLCAQDSPNDGRLPLLGDAPGFVLTGQDGARVALKDWRGKVLAVTFVYTSCADTCPLLTAKLVQVQNRLGASFGSRIAFIAITVDPLRDTPDRLKRYATAQGVNWAGWAFLTGSPAEIARVTRRYGVYAGPVLNGQVNHTFLTSLIDARGKLRVQYMGVRFDPEEFRRDLLALLEER